MSAHDWTRWTPAAMPSGPHWRLIRFDAVDADGKPVGKAIEARTPSLHTRKFFTEAAAQGCADLLNEEEGR